jgi:outer membrane lipoprotein-sorting protein
MLKRSALAMVVAVGATGLTGCFSTTRLVQKTQAPEVYRTESVETLEKDIANRDAAIKTLNAQVMITASVGGGSTGKVTEYTSFKGYIFVQRPDLMRVLMQKPLLGSRALDMVSNGDHFTMVRATVSGGDVWAQGSNTVSKPSKNGLENLRPPVFLNSLLVPGVGPDEYVTLTESTRVIQPETKHHDAIQEPDYDLSFSKVRLGRILQQERVIHISRVSMLPFQQDIYDDSGKLVTQARYENYQKYGEQQFPSLITITRPVDEYSLKIEVTKLTLNQEFEADQFELKVPDGVKVQVMQ